MTSIPLGRAVALSALLHAAALWLVWSNPRPTLAKGDGPSTRLLSVQLRDRSAARGGPLRTSNVLAKPAIPEERKTKGRLRAMPTDARPAQRASSSGPSTEGAEAKDLGPLAARATEDPLQAGGEPSIRSTAAVLGGSGSGGSGGSGGGREGAPAALIHRALADAARSCYPDSARRFRLRGTVLLSFCLDGVGGARDVTIVRSSGHGALDRAAHECVVGRARLPAASGCVAAPIEFSESPR